MANSVLIIGESGSGKSTSIRTLNPAETFVLNVLSKPMPFRDFSSSYKPLSRDGTQGNYYTSSQFKMVENVIKLVNLKRADIKTLIIDDFQYLMASYFMDKYKERGFDKFSEIGKQVWDLINLVNECRSDLDVFILSHSEETDDGRVKAKTIGKLLNEKVTVEGMFTIVLSTSIVNNSYGFITQSDGKTIAKSPLGMFDSLIINNDLQLVKNKIAEYYGVKDEPQPLSN